MGFFKKVRDRLAALVPWRRRAAKVRQQHGELVSLRDEFRSELDRMFNRHFSPLGGRWWPAIDLQSNDSEYMLTADVPGLCEKDLDVRVTGDSVVIRGERSTEQEEQRNGFYRIERGYGSFHRSVPLPADAEPEGASANYKHGVLRVRIPRSRSSVRRIPVAA